MNVKNAIIMIIMTKIKLHDDDDDDDNETTLCK